MAALSRVQAKRDQLRDGLAAPYASAQSARLFRRQRRVDSEQESRC